jgi:hypothetical protein
MPDAPARLLTFQVICTKQDIFRAFNHTYVRTPSFYYVAAAPTAVCELILFFARFQGTVKLLDGRGGKVESQFHAI